MTAPLTVPILALLIVILYSVMFIGPTVLVILLPLALISGGCLLIGSRQDKRKLKAQKLPNLEQKSKELEEQAGLDLTTTSIITENDRVSQELDRILNPQIEPRPKRMGMEVCPVCGSSGMYQRHVDEVMCEPCGYVGVSGGTAERLKALEVRNKKVPTDHGVPYNTPFGELVNYHERLSTWDEFVKATQAKDLAEEIDRQKAQLIAAYRVPSHAIHSLDEPYPRRLHDDCFLCDHPELP